MTYFFSPAFVTDVARLLLIVGVAGLVSLFFTLAGRRRAKQAMAVLFVALVAGGAALSWWSDRLRAADRYLTASEQAALAGAFSRFPAIKFTVVTQGADKEADALAHEVVDAIKAGRGAAPIFEQSLVKPPKGVVLGIRDRDSAAGRSLDAVGRAFMAAGIATLADLVPELDDDTMRIVVGKKP